MSNPVMKKCMPSDFNDEEVRGRESIVPTELVTHSSNKNIGLIAQLDLLTLVEVEKIIVVIDSIENAFNKIDHKRFDHD